MNWTIEAVAGLAECVMFLTIAVVAAGWSIRQQRKLKLEIAKLEKPEAPYPLAEFDIQGVDVIGIDRRWDAAENRYVTNIDFKVGEYRKVKTRSFVCSDEQHAAFVQRFQHKLGLLTTKSAERA